MIIDNRKQVLSSIVHRLSISIDELISIVIDCYRLPPIIDFIDCSRPDKSSHGNFDSYSRFIQDPGCKPAVEKET